MRRIMVVFVFVLVLSKVAISIDNVWASGDGDSIQLTIPTPTLSPTPTPTPSYIKNVYLSVWGDYNGDGIVEPKGDGGTDERITIHCSKSKSTLFDGHTIYWHNTCRDEPVSYHVAWLQFFYDENGVFENWSFSLYGEWPRDMFLCPKGRYLSRDELEAFFASCSTEDAGFSNSACWLACQPMANIFLPIVSGNWHANRSRLAFYKTYWSIDKDRKQDGGWPFGEGHLANIECIRSYSVRPNGSMWKYDFGCDGEYLKGSNPVRFEFRGPDEGFSSWWYEIDGRSAYDEFGKRYSCPDNGSLTWSEIIDLSEKCFDPLSANDSCQVACTEQ